MSCDEIIKYLKQITNLFKVLQKATKEIKHESQSRKIKIVEKLMCKKLRKFSILFK